MSAASPPTLRLEVTSGAAWGAAASAPPGWGAAS
jgi:hypothetical protein